MTIKNTPEQLAAIEAALAKIHVHPFTCQSSDAKYNAQRNLSGITHYVDDDTLRFHKSRLQCASTLANGLLFYICTSDALDMHNTKRGFRYVVFDLFGTTVSRPGLEDARATRPAARREFENLEFDVAAHYASAMAHNVERMRGDLAELETALSQITALQAAA